MAKLLTAFKNPRQPPPRFHYENIHESQQVVNDTIAEGVLVMTVVAVSGLKAGRGNNVYVRIEMPYNPHGEKAQVAKSGTCASPSLVFVENHA